MEMQINFNDLAQGRPQVCVCSAVSDSATPWTIAHKAPLSMAFSRQEYWSGLPFPTPWDLPDPGIKLIASLALAGRFFPNPSPEKPLYIW